MNHQQEQPFFGHSNRGVSLLPLDARVFKMNQAVEEDLAGNLKVDSMLSHIRQRFLRVPDEVNALVEKVDVHKLNVYTLYIESQEIGLR